MGDSVPAALRRRVVQSFKLQGLTLQSGATSVLAEVLEPYRDSGDLDEIVERIVEAVQQQPLSSSLIGRETVLAAVEEVNEASDADKEKALVVIDAFEIPKFTYNPDQKRFLPVPRSSLSLHSSAGDKAALFRSRYTLILQQTARHELFAPTTFGQSASTDDSNSRFQLHKVEGLLGQTGFVDKVIVLGILTRIKEGKVHLEDPTGCVELDLANTVFHTGLFVESSLVLAEGVFEEKVFHVSAVGFPPPEPPSVTRNYFGNVNFFGGPSTVCAKSSEKLQAMLAENEDAMFVFLSDIFLNEPRVMERLATLFSGYSEAPPTAIVLMGDFSSAPYGPLTNQKLREDFKSLAELMMRFPTLVKNSQFLFVPGPQDPGPGNLLPRPPIPSVLTSDLTSRVPTAKFCSNPVRIQFCTREIVVFRDDILGKMCRNCVRFPTKSADLPTHFTKTLLSQGHLCPLPLHSRPVYWAFDHALQLHPLPDLVVIGDKCDPFTVTSGETTVANTGSFLRSDFEFKVYMPSSGQVEDSKIAN
ncbi:DNA polymerase epsilon subunit 2 [Geodia barretti]|uniref:DNA polymerase epsilon subunit n=1 Tax=Geodia barretti TaxID=519541 RepID=A0AA35U0D4_GEOBA|nr:DNA polymerase epsilon subunit 2 [Geodia barretti]